MSDVMQRLRAADPVPGPVAYDDSVAQRNIDAITRTDLTVGHTVAPLRRPHRRAWTAVAAVAVVVAVGGTILGLETSRDRSDGPPVAPTSAPTGSVAAVPWATFSANGVSFEYSTEWTSYPVEYASTMSAAVAYLSTVAFPPVCTTTTTATGTMTGCHHPEPDLRGGGTFVDWTYQFSPGTLSLDSYPGTPTVIGGLDARVDTTALPDECGPTGAVRGVSAALASATNNVLTMTACVGPGDVDADLAAVDRMLASVRIDR